MPIRWCRPAVSRFAAARLRCREMMGCLSGEAILGAGSDRECEASYVYGGRSVGVAAFRMSPGRRSVSSPGADANATCVPIISAC